MLKFVLFTALCFVCYKTNPDEKSFKKYMEQKRKEKTSTTNSKVLNKMNNLLSQAVAPLPDYTYQNYSVCSICTVKPNGPTFLGICNTWYPISGEKRTEQQNEAEAEKKLEEMVISGNREKANKNYNEAVKLYTKAAQGYEKDHNTYEAAINYENAFKSYQSDENYSHAIDSAKNAAKLFASQDRTYSRAARLYESMAQISKKQKNLKGAYDNYTSAINLYNKMDNNSGMQTRIAQGNLGAEIGGSYAENAINIFEDIAKRSVDEPLLKYNVSNSLGKASLITLNKCVTKNNFNVLTNTLGKYIRDYPVFEDSAEYNLCHDVDLALSNNDIEKVMDLCNKYKQTHSLTEWETSILNNVIEYADKKDISIL